MHTTLRTLHAARRCGSLLGEVRWCGKEGRKRLSQMSFHRGERGDGWWRAGWREERRTYPLVQQTSTHFQQTFSHAQQVSSPPSHPPRPSSNISPTRTSRHPRTVLHTDLHTADRTDRHRDRHIVSTLVLLCDRDVSDVFFRCPRFVSRVPCVFVPALFRVAEMADSAKMRAVTSHLTPPRKRSFEQTGLKSSMDGSQLERHAEHSIHH